MVFDTQLLLSKRSDGYDAFCIIDYPGRSSLSNASLLTTLEFKLNGRRISLMRLGAHLSDHPTIGVTLKQVSPGDRLSVEWRDSAQNQGRAELKVS